MMHTVLIIEKRTMITMIDQCRQVLPNEGCGYLAGNDNRVDVCYPMKNIDQSPEHFQFDPNEQFSTLKKARVAGKQLRVVYHSHPSTPARLSQEDLRLLNDPNMIYVIVSFSAKDPVVKAYRIMKDEHKITVYDIQIISDKTIKETH